MNDGAFRGILLVGVATLIGVVLLGSGLDDTAVSIGGLEDATDEVPDDVAPGEDEEEPPQTVTPGDALAPAEVPVIVANGSGVSGAAGQVTEELRAQGYTSAGDPVDAEPAEFDTVYWAENPERDFRAEAEALAATLGLDPSAVVPLPDPPPAPVGLAGVLLVLGAQGTLAAGG